MSKLGKTLGKIRKNKKINIKIPHVNKKTTSEKGKFKLKTRPRMNYDSIGKTIREIRSEKSKTVKKTK